MPLDINLVGKASRGLPSKTSDSGITGPERRGPYGETFTLPIYQDMASAADEGTYWTVNNNQTGLPTGATPTAFSTTNPFLLVYNTESDPSIGKRILFDYATLLATAAGTAGTSVQFAVTIDIGNRYASGGTEITNQIVNVNGAYSKSSVAKVYAGNITASAATTSVRTLVGNRWMKSAIPVIGDTHVVKFGGIDAPTMIGISTIVFSLNNIPKVIIPANWSMLLHLWLPAQSAASSFAPELGWIER